MTRWSLDPILDSYPIVCGLTLLLLVLLIVVRPWQRGQNRRRQRYLMGLRAAVIAIVALAMLRPAHVSSTHRPQAATLVLLVDQSRSMNVQDGAAGKTRWQELLAVLQRAKQPLESLAELIEIQGYGFSQSLDSPSYVEGNWKLPAAPGGEQTDLGAALSAALQREAGKRLAGVVVLSDGAQRVYAPQFDLQQIARELTRRSVPLYTLPFGKPREQSQARDVAIERLQDQYTVFVKNEAVIRGGVRVQGYANRAIPVRVLVDGPAGVPRRTLGPLNMTAKEDNELVEFAFPFVPEVAGTYRLRVEAKPQDGELVVANNELTAYVNVLDGGLRVLYLDGNLLGAEQKTLRQSWSASPDIELDFRVIDPRLQDQWPVDLTEVWSGTPYDVLVLGDVDASALGTENLARMAKLTAQGRGLLMLGGVHALGAGGYRGTPLAEALPVTFGQFDRQSFGSQEPIRQDIHVPGPLEIVPTRPHFTTHLAEGDDNLAAWRQLNRHPLLGANRFSSLTPDALRLADSQHGDPLLVARQFGGGRVLVFAADSSYLWWKYGQQDLHKRFWRQVVLWLANREDQLRRDVWVSLPRRRFRPGEPVPFTAGARAENGDVLTQAEITARVRLETGEPQDIRLVREGDDWRAQLEELDQPGEYTIEVTARLNGQAIGSASAQFQIHAVDLELADPAANPQLLELLATLNAPAGGRTLPPEQLTGLLEEIRNKPPELEIEVESKWRFGDTAADSWIAFLLTVTLLGLEWTLRKRWGLA